MPWVGLRCIIVVFPDHTHFFFFPVTLLLTNLETLYNLNIVLSFHPPFEPITALFTNQEYGLLYFVLCIVYHSDANTPSVKSTNKQVVNFS